MEFNRQEYNSVILATLFHDIGKVVQGSNHYNNCPKDFSSHYGIGKRLVNDLFKENILKFQDNQIKKDLVCELIENHHDAQIEKNKNVLGKNLNLAHIVSISDSYSSRERDVTRLDQTKDIKKGRLKSLLVSVFSQIIKGNSDWYYKINKLHDDYKYILPENVQDTEDIKSDYTEIINEFIKDLKGVENKNFYDYINKIQGLMEEYFWAVPSVTINEINDISLYDHAVSSTAIAAALYKYHYETDSLNNIQELRNEKTKKFLLIAGDITGIQNFIFDINTINPKKLSKELRGRSFFISLLGNLISLKILNKLDLPYTNKIIDAGGKFWILAPNTETTIKILNEIKEEIETVITQELYCSLIPVIDSSVNFSSEQFKSDKLPELIKNIEYNLAREKMRKLHNSYFKNFKLDKMYDEFIKNGLCHMCKNNPEEEDKDNCKICNMCINLGDKITKSKYIIYKENQENKLFFGYDVFFENEINNNNYVLIEQIADYKNYVAKIKDISNFLPKDNKNEPLIDIKTDDNEESLCFYCKNKCKDFKTREELLKNFLSFQCIATITPYKNNGSASDHLAIIKGDVDNLGYIFSAGLNKKLTFSRYVYLSRMMNLFFTYFLKEFIKEKYPYIYTIYAGGDDFLFLGPWEEIINMIIEIRDEFSKYVCENKDIHFSAAINLFRPKEPILEVVEEADKLLDEAKEKDLEKNKLNIFNEVVDFSYFKKSKEIFLKLDEFLKKEVLKTSTLYRILEYIDLYKKFVQTKNIEYLKYDYLWTYDLNRNFSEKKCRENSGVKEAKEFIFKLKENENELEKLKIPIYWVIYKNRKTKKEAKNGTS